MKKKFGIIGIALVVALMASLCFSTVALAADPPEEGTVTIDMQGDNYGFNVHTQLNDVPWDNFSGEAHSTLHMHQTVTYYPSGNSNIDRTAQFWGGDGSINVATNYDNPWESYGTGAHSILYAYVECSGSEGFLSQSLLFRGNANHKNRGGATNMDIWANGGGYELGFGAVDLRGGLDANNEPIDPDWWFDFCAADSGSGGSLHVDDAWTQVQQGRSHWGQPDSFHVDFGFVWEGNAGSQTTWYGEFQPGGSDKGYDQPGNINMSIDIINNFVGGSGEIW